MSLRLLVMLSQANILGYLQRMEEARKPHSNSLKIDFCVKSILAVVSVFQKQVEKG
jgi:hypothetical protein